MDGIRSWDDLGMHALVTVTLGTHTHNGWGMDALVMRCTQHKRYYGLGMDAGHRVLLQHERFYGWTLCALTFGRGNTRIALGHLSVTCKDSMHATFPF